ncbi:MAG: NosD domain-containing protein, partial [Euryarchaeota archaeon]|nr:NosD domain-containing protein [Euryarchaeota archaeon]
ISRSRTVSSPSINNTLIGNIASSNHGAGICVYGYSNNTTLMKNTANSNKDNGIYLFSSGNNTLTGNTVNSNNGDGIHLSSSSNNNITCNGVQKNTRNGFCLFRESTDNNISYNNIIKNGNYNKTSGGWQWQVYNGQSTPCEVKHNYWGAGMNNTTIDAGIYVEGNYEGGVVFYPFEIYPISGIPVTEETHTFTTADAAIALEIASGIHEYDPLWDINRDGHVTSIDALMILQGVVR